MAKSEALLAAALQKIVAKPPRKFSSALVSDIFSKINSPRDLRSLYESNYLKTILWPYFHQDVTNQHLHLILLSLIYSIQSEHDFSLLAHIESDASEFSQFLKRILQSSLHPFNGDEDFMCVIFLFLGYLSLSNASVLTEHSFFQMWLDSVVSDAAKFAFKEQILPTEETVIRHFAFFILSSAKGPLLQKIKDLQIPAFFHYLSDPIVEALVLQTYTSIRNTDAFDDVRLKARELNFESLAYCPLEYNLDSQDLLDSLRDLPENNLKELAKAAGYNGDIDDFGFLANVVVRNILSVEEGNWARFSETQLFDWHDWKLNLPVAVPVLLALSESEYSSILSFWEFSVAQKLNAHLVSCLKRLEINNGTIKGKSKYYLPLSSFQQVGFTGIASVKSSGFQKNELVVLWKLDKTNKYDDFLRMQQFGISKATVATVESIPDSSTLQLRMDSPLDNYDGLVKIPQDLNMLRNVDPEDAADAMKILLDDKKVSLRDGLSEGFVSEYFAKHKKCLLVLPTTEHVKRLAVKDVDLETLKLGDEADLAEKIDHCKQVVSEISTKLGLSQFDFDSSFRNMLMLYEMHVAKHWGTFLRQLSKQKKTWLKYLFKELQFDDDKTEKECMLEIVDHYHSIKRTFALVERLLILDKVPGMGTFALAYQFPFVVGTADDLVPLDLRSEHVISCVDEETLGFVEIAQSLVVVGEGRVYRKLRNLGLSVAELEKSLLSGDLAALAKPVQHVKVTRDSGQVNIEEAQFIVAFVRFLLRKKYPLLWLSIVVSSPYMKLLILEIAEEANVEVPVVQHVDEPLVPSEIVIFLYHGDPTFGSAKKAELSAKRGFISFGGYGKTHALEIVEKEEFSQISEKRRVTKVLDPADLE